MIRSFGDAGTEDLFYRRDTKQARKVCPQEAWAAARRKLEYLNVAHSIAELIALPTEFKRLKGPMEGWCSLRVNDRYRVLFQWKEEAAWEVRVTDYH